jgi:hypothetical protein
MQQPGALAGRAVEQAGSESKAARRAGHRRARVRHQLLASAPAAGLPHGGPQDARRGQQPRTPVLEAADHHHNSSALMRKIGRCGA